MISATTVDLFAGIPVSDYVASVAWYEKLLGPAAFIPDGNEIGFGGAPL